MCDKVQRLIDESNAENKRIIAEQQKVLEAQKAKYDSIIKSVKSTY